MFLAKTRRRMSIVEFISNSESAAFIKRRFTFRGRNAKIIVCLGVAQLVARSVRDAEVVSSSLITQTIDM